MTGIGLLGNIVFGYALWQHPELWQADAFIPARAVGWLFLGFSCIVADLLMHRQ